MNAAAPTAMPTRLPLPRPDPVQAAYDEWASEEWRRLVDLEKQRLRAKRGLWFFLRNLAMRRVRITLTWSNPR